jgi:hypothetical protein
MKMLNRVRTRRTSAEAADPGAPHEGASDGVPIPGYDRLGAKEIAERLRELSQVDLAAVEAYERSHENRPAVLAKLHYMRTDEPLPGYDALSVEQILETLADTDAQTVKAVRDYERKFAQRTPVLKEAARVLPTSPASAEEDRVREEKAERLAEGYAVRKKTVDEG